VRWAFVVVLAGCSFEHGSVSGTPADGPADSRLIDTMGMIDTPDGTAPSSLREKTITIQPAITGTHTDFPLWISLTDSDLAARALTDGSDIHFVDANGPLDYEIQSWTKSTGRLDAWVRVPSLAAGKTLLIRYGDAAVAHLPDPPGTFAGYQAVWHFEDSLATNAIVDTRNLHNGTTTALTTTDSVAAQLGRGINFSEGTDQIAFTNPLTGATPHTISMWINQRATTSNDCIISMGNGVMNQARWFHSRYNSATIATGFYTNDYTAANEDIIGDGWVLLAWVFEGQNRMTRIYRNGTLVAGPFQHASGINTQGSGGAIGNAQSAFGTNMGLNATLDEVRIINVARSASWLAAEALNQTSPGMAYTIGTEQTPP
jgi:hypothetical protein